MAGAAEANPEASSRARILKRVRADLLMLTLKRFLSAITKIALRLGLILTRACTRDLGSVSQMRTFKTGRDLPEATEMRSESSGRRTGLSHCGH